MRKVCKQCGSAFEITSEDLEFLKKVSPVFSGKKYAIPAPTLCPDCRQQRRLSWRNERNLYTRRCSKTAKRIISMYSGDKSFPVYDTEVWWSDRFDPLEFGRDFDFNKSFFDQFKVLILSVPRMSLINKEPANSEYCNFSLRNKNSYLLFTSAECEDSCYCSRAWKSRSVIDGSNILNCELCYEVVDSEACYNCCWVKNCSNCSDCIFGQNLRGCRNCFACFGLVNKSFCIGNDQYSQKEYLEKVKVLMADLSKSKDNYYDWLKKMPRCHMEATNVENCTGDNIFNSKNAISCFEVKDLLDCEYVFDATFLKDCHDINNDDHSELVYECIGSESNYQHCFNDICWFNSEMYYCSLCFNSKNCFGCVGLKNNQYCIFNKQYTKERYEELVSRIIEYMQKTGEWGEFFPAEISPFAYNETMGNDYYPMTEAQVSQKGWKWKEKEKKDYISQTFKVPKKITDVENSICDEVLACEETGKNFKIQKIELDFYRKMSLPIPELCPDVRYFKRLQLRNPRKLWARQCMKCGAQIQTTYPPERPEKVYCEKCYLKEVY